MRIVVTAFLDQLYELLRQGPQLVTLYDQKDIAFVPSLKSWLEESESVLEKYHQPQVSEIAGIRGQLLSASHGVFDKNVIHFSGKGNDRKTIQAGAAILFNRAQKTLSDNYQSFSANKEEATKYMRQIIIIALQKDSFYPIWNGVAEVPEKLNILWQAFAVSLIWYREFVRYSHRSITWTGYASWMKS